MALRLYALLAALILGCTMSAAGTYRLMAGKLHNAETARDIYANALAAAQKQRKADQALLARRYAANAAAARELARVRQQLADALAANREWADQPVPKEVRDALREP